MSDSRALLSERSFLLYQGVRFVTVVAMNMMSVAIGAEVYAETHDPLALGLSGLAQFVPQFALVLVTGAVADRFPRRLVLMGCHAVIALVALALSHLARAASFDVHAVYAVLALFGCARSFAGPAGQAITPSLVPPELFARAVGWNATTFQVAVALGPALGGALYRPLGPATLYELVAGLETVVIAQLFFVRERPYERKLGEPTLERIFAGIRYVRDHRAILGSISLDLFAVLLGGAVALMPIYASEVLHVGEVGLGALRAAPALGALVVALVLGVRPIERGAGRKMLVAVAVFGLATIAFGVSTSFVLSLIALFVVGASDMVSVVVRSIVVQATTPPDMRGRVSAVNMVFVGASNELGEFESGAMARLLGTVLSVVVGGVGTLLVTAYYWRFFPELRDVDHPEG